MSLYGTRREEVKNYKRESMKEKVIKIYA